MWYVKRQQFPIEARRIKKNQSARKAGKNHLYAADTLECGKWQWDVYKPRHCRRKRECTKPEHTHRQGAKQLSCCLETISRSLVADRIWCETCDYVFIHFYYYKTNIYNVGFLRTNNDFRSDYITYIQRLIYSSSFSRSLVSRPSLSLLSQICLFLSLAFSIHSSLSTLSPIPYFH